MLRDDLLDLSNASKELVAGLEAYNS